MHISRIFSIIALLLPLMLQGCWSRASSGSNEAENEAVEPVYPLGFNPDTLRCESHKVASNEVLTGLLQKRGMALKEIYPFVDSVKSVFNPRKLRAGRQYEAYYSLKDSLSLEYIVYSEGIASQTVFRCQKPYSAWTVEKEVARQTLSADVTIKTSLWDDMMAAGASPALILKLSDVYAWTVDFYGLQKNDRFRVLYDALSCEGQLIDIDTLRYAVFTHAGHDYPCVMFNQGDGGNIYWNEKGESMRKAFLKAPLHFTRISSGYSNARRHPITRKVQPHTGVDYAAPAGTPVSSIGDGVVISAKDEGAGGKTIRIKHNSVYTTAYLHLSGYAKGIKAGVRVAQGQTIGYVGSTGRSTGPHLDFRIWKNGSPINPLTLDSPPAEPIKEEFMPAFLQLADSLSRTLF